MICCALVSGCGGHTSENVCPLPAEKAQRLSRTPDSARTSDLSEPAQPDHIQADWNRANPNTDSLSRPHLIPGQPASLPQSPSQREEGGKHSGGWREMRQKAVRNQPWTLRSRCLEWAHNWSIAFPEHLPQQLPCTMTNGTGWDIIAIFTFPKNWRFFGLFLQSSHTEPTSKNTLHYWVDLGHFVLPVCTGQRVQCYVLNPCRC